MKKILSLFIFVIFFTINCYAQMRVVVLPFANMDGLMSFNIACYQMQDSVFKALKKEDINEKYYHLVPHDSVEAILTEYNIDPNNPQYPSDVWKVVRMLNCKYAVSGNFNLQSGKILINAYVFNTKTKIANPDHQARDIFLDNDKYLLSIPEIIRAILPVLKPQQE